jgi:plastocyanin
MRTAHLRRAGALTAVTAVGVIGFATVGGASAKPVNKADDETAATITMAVDGKNLVFQGPRSVDSGSQLKIVNATDPSKVGPHTFTLVDKSDLPKDKQSIKDCEKLKSDFCAGIVKDHKVNLKTGKIGRPSLDTGKKGWDTPYTEDEKGDSWVAQAEGDTQKREVSAKPGTTLYYFCLVHPFMQGKIKVK